MKRDPNIVPLSRDHHTGLLFCWKIRQGLKLNVEPERILPYVRYFWQNHLRNHFAEEENLLFILKEDVVCERAQNEHRSIELLMSQIEEANKRKLQELTDLLEQHIRFEERELFPYLEEQLTPAQLTDIGMALNSLHERPNLDKYDDAFWEYPKGK